MGFINSLKRIFNKNIECGDEVEKYIVYMYPLSNRGVKINSNIVVRKDFVAVIVVGDKVQDIISSGKHKINGSTLPATYEKLKLGKPSKKGNLKKKFKADIYFINLKSFDSFEYTSNEPFIAKSDNFGKIKGFCEGLCTFKITSSEDVVRFLLRDVKFIKNGYAEKELSYLIGNVVNRMLEKSRLGFVDVLLNPQILNDYLKENMIDKLADYGVEVEDVVLNSFKLSNKIQKKVNEFLSGNATYGEGDFGAVTILEKENDIISEIANRPEPDKIFVDLKNEKISAMSMNETISEVAYKEPESVDTNNKQYNTNNNTNFNRRAVDGKSIINNTNNIYKKPALNTSAVLSDSEKLKQCKYCGGAIEAHHKFCPLCGFKQIT